MLFGEWSGTEVKIDGQELLVSMGCGIGEAIVNGVCVPRAGMRQARRTVRRCARWHGGVCVM